MTATDLDDRTYDLLFSTRRSVRYHMHRRRFFEIWNTVTVAVSALGGSAAVVTFVSNQEQLSWLVPALSAMIGLVAAVDLAVGTTRRANEHGDLARQFISLEMKFVDGKNLSEDDYEQLRRERLNIEAREPPVLRLLDVMCHYELLRSMGDQTRHPGVRVWRRALMHWFSQALFARNLIQS